MLVDSHCLKVHRAHTVTEEACVPTGEPRKKVGRTPLGMKTHLMCG